MQANKIKFSGSNHTQILKFISPNIEKDAEVGIAQRKEFEKELGIKVGDFIIKHPNGKIELERKRIAKNN